MSFNGLTIRERIASGEWTIEWMVRHTLDVHDALRVLFYGYTRVISVLSVDIDEAQRTSEMVSSISKKIPSRINLPTYFMRVGLKESDIPSAPDDLTEEQIAVLLELASCGLVFKNSHDYVRAFYEL